MRTITKNIAGKEYKLTADFAASAEIAESVGDPLEIARESATESYFLENGIPYRPNWKFTIHNVVKILQIATKAPLEEMQDAVFEEGFINCKDIAAEYLGKIVGPGPQSVVDTKGHEPSGKSDGSIS